MNKKRTIGFLFCIIFFLALISPAFSQEKLDSGWKKGRVTAIGKDFIRVDGVRYPVSPNVVIKGVYGDLLGPNLKKLRDVDLIMFRTAIKGDIVEIRIVRLTS